MNTIYDKKLYFGTSGFKAVRTILLILFFIHSSLEAFSSAEKQMEEADAYYEVGLHSATLMERQRAFNQALESYKKLESDEIIPRRSENLEEAIGNSYFQLGEYPHAILYYSRALKYRGASQQLLEHLELAQKKAEISAPLQIPLINRLLSFNFLLSLSERFQLFFLLSLLFIALFSSAVWYPSNRMKGCSYILLVLSLVMFLNLLASIYANPIEAIVIEPSGIYREPTIEQAQLLTAPLSRGDKVNVLDVQKQGNWLKIRTNEVVGYISSRSVVII